MAFSAAEKTRMLYFLGYSVFEDDGPAMRAINSLDSKEAQGGPIIRAILDRLTQLETEIMNTIPLSVAVQDGSIQLRAHYTLAHLWNLARSEVNKLSRFVKVAVVGNVFAAASNSSDPSSFYSGDPSESRLDLSSGMPTRESGGGY